MIKQKLQNERIVCEDKTWAGYQTKKAKQTIKDLKERENDYRKDLPVSIEPDKRPQTSL